MPGIAVVALAATLSACAVGPDFERPATPAVAGYTPEPLGSTAASEAFAGTPQLFVTGENVAADWWTLFKSPALSALVEQAIANNTDLQAADANLRQAQELQKAQFAILLPSVDGQFGVSRQKNYANFGGGGAASIPPYTLATASVAVSYGLDIWGGARRSYEGTRAQTDQIRFQMEAARLAVTSNTVAAAVQQAALRAQVEATQSIIDVQEQQLGVLRRQLELGAVAEADVLTQLTALAQSRAQLPPLQKQLAQNTSLLLVLTGRTPDEALGAQFDLAALELPKELPVSLPSALVTQRPDIRASEAGLRSANAQIGLATALMLPQISLDANYGASGSSVSQLFNAGSTVWGLSAGLLQPIFRGGELLHKRRAAVAAFDAASAQYRGVVLNAFKDVSDVLRALQIDAEAVKVLSEAERAAATSLEIAQNSYSSGATNFLTLLDAQRTYQQTRIALVQAQASRYADTAALFAALGGGWWNRPENADGENMTARVND